MPDRVHEMECRLVLEADAFATCVHFSCCYCLLFPERPPPTALIVLLPPYFPTSLLPYFPTSLLSFSTYE